MDRLTDSCVMPREPETTTELAISEPEIAESPRKSEKLIHDPEPPREAKREAPVPSVECTVSKNKESAAEELCTRERLKRHRQEMAGRVWIPDIWGQEGFLKEWKDCNTNVFDRSLVPKGLVSARDALVEECRRTANSSRSIRVQKSC